MGEPLYDAIVVGSGPGGATAAYTLAQGGWNVLVLEKARLPRYKPCGGGVSLGLLQRFPFSLDAVVEARPTSVAYALGRRQVVQPLPGAPIQMVMRERFDLRILEQAGVEVRQDAPVAAVREGGDGVEVETRGGDRFRARYVVGADGASSVVARESGLRRKKRLAAAIEVEVAASPELLERFAEQPLFVFGEIRFGYLWVFPKANVLSVGVGALSPRPGELKATLERVMARYGISLEVAKLHGHPLPFYAGREPIATPRVLLVGDAAGLVDPLTGEGIRFAAKSGRIAAEELLRGTPDRYGRRVHVEIGMSHGVALALALLFYTCPKTCYALGVRNPHATRAFVDLLCERARYPQVLARLFGTLPRWLFEEATALVAGMIGGAKARRRPRIGVRE